MNRFLSLSNGLMLLLCLARGLSVAHPVEREAGTAGSDGSK